MQHSIRGSDVFIKNDLRAILDGLDIAARHQPSGCFRDGWLSATNAMRASIGIEAEQPEIVTVERYERYERIEQRRQAPAERQFKIVGEREEWLASEPDQTAPVLAETDVEYDDFVPGRGEMRRMEAGWMWLGNDGSKRFYPIQQWVELSADDARSLGCLIADNRRFVLFVRTALAERQRQRQLTGDRRLLR